METPRRLVFGEMAQRYDRYRPAYPDPLIDELVRVAHTHHGLRALEIGAGTGKATIQFAQRGVSVLAVEPSGEMAEVARHHLRDFPEVEIVLADFESFDPGQERFALVYSAQAWHWIDPDAGLRCARAALTDGGLLAPFWNFDVWMPSPLRDELAAVYEQVVPDLIADNSWHPAAEGEEDRWVDEIGETPLFADPEVRFFQGSRDFTAQGYVELLGTYSRIHMLADDVREQLLNEIRDAINRHGGTLTMPSVTRLCTARAV